MPKGWTDAESHGEQHNGDFNVSDCANSFRKFLTEAYATGFADLEADKRPMLGVVVAGYSSKEFFPEIWRFVLPHDEEIHNQRPDVEGKPDFGASWFGRTDAIVRFHFGRDDALPSILEEKFGVPSADIRQALAPLEYPMTFQAMPLQDAIEYAHFMVDLTIGRYHHVVGPELCAGQVDVAAITPQSLKWVARKEHGLRLEA